VAHDAIIGQLSQAGANRGGTHAAELAQLLDGDRLIQAGQDDKSPEINSSHVALIRSV
jgi:hypothetical protein